MVVDKIKTGVPGLDKICKGGIKKNSSIIVTGGPGTGKSILGMQFLAEGAKRGEIGLLLLYDSHESDFLDYADELKIPIRKYVKEKKIIIFHQELSMYKVDSFSTPLKLIKSKKVQRVVLDSLTMFSYMHVKEEKEYRKKIIEFLYNLKDVTLLATSEADKLDVGEISFKPEDFLFDGMLFMGKIRRASSFERIFQVSKLRGQEHLMDIFPFTITKKGIEIFPDQLPFGLLEEDEDK